MCKFARSVKKYTLFDSKQFISCTLYFYTTSGCDGCDKYEVCPVIHTTTILDVRTSKRTRGINQMGEKECILANQYNIGKKKLPCPCGSKTFHLFVCLFKVISKMTIELRFVMLVPKFFWGHLAWKL